MKAMRVEREFLRVDEVGVVRVERRDCMRVVVVNESSESHMELRDVLMSKMD